MLFHNILATQSNIVNLELVNISVDTGNSLGHKLFVLVSGEVLDLDLTGVRIKDFIRTFLAIDGLVRVHRSVISRSRINFNHINSIVIPKHIKLLALFNLTSILPGLVNVHTPVDRLKVLFGVINAEKEVVDVDIEASPLNEFICAPLKNLFHTLSMISHTSRIDLLAK